MPISTIGSNSLNQTSDLTINGQTVGKGGGNVASNTVHGVSALAGNSSGTNNTAVGYQALTANTANSNTAFGWSTLLNNTSGSPNNAFGNNALITNTTGGWNVALGHSALYTNNGSYNIAVGGQALYSNTTGSYNTATGYQAGYSNAQGSANTFLGYQAGYTFAASSATSTYNTFLGYSAGYLATTGTNNTFVGNGAGQSVTTGGKNTILGNYGGNQGGLDIRTSSNYIVLSDGDGNPRHYWTGDGTSYMGFTSTGAIESYISSSCGRANYYNAAGATRSCQYYYYSAVEKGSISITSTGVTYNTVSDYRLKENIAPMTGALAKVAQLKPVTYKWKEDGSNGQGFIAHELKEVVPDCVSGEKDAVDEDGKPVYQGIDTSFLVATLTAAIQELKTIVDAQAAEIAELKAKVA